MPINRRHVLAGAAAGLCLSGTAAAAADNEPRLIREDYGLARQRFQTRLLERGPASTARTRPSVSRSVERSQAVGLNVQRGVIEGDHSSAIPGESEESLRFFASS
jgi:hypothetical protein